MLNKEKWNENNAIVPGLNDIIGNPLDALHRGTGFKIPGFDFQVYPIS
jgi:hypothetical protein